VALCARLNELYKFAIKLLSDSMTFRNRHSFKAINQAYLIKNKYKWKSVGKT